MMTQTVIEVFILIVAFQLKHYIADYILQFRIKDAIKKFDAEGWIKPLSIHAFHHFGGTFTISTLYLGYCEFCPYSLYFWTLVMSVSILDFVAHFTIDRLKASPNIGGRFHYPTKEYFQIMGLDQMAHHLTHYLITFALIYFSKT